VRVQAFRNLVAIGIPPHEDARRVLTYTADYPSTREPGRLRHGAHANIIVLAPIGQLPDTLRGGEPIELVDA